MLGDDKKRKAEFPCPGVSFFANPFSIAARSIKPSQKNRNNYGCYKRHNQD